MINYYAKQAEGAIYKIDFDSKKFDRINYFGRIADSYYIDEDGILTVTTPSGEKTYEVHKGDLVLKMYSANGTYGDKEYFIVHCDDIIDYVNRYNTFVEENKKKKCADEETCCDVTSLADR